MGQNQYLIQILILIALFAFSGIGWIYKQLQEQRERKKAIQARERRFEEMLRTGRDPLEAGGPGGGPMSPADRARLEELARRRQMQMEQLRREHHQRRQAEERAAREEQAIPPIILMGPAGPITLPREAGPPPRSPQPRQTRPGQAPSRPGAGQRSGQSSGPRAGRGGAGGAQQPQRGRREQRVEAAQPIIVPPTAPGGQSPVSAYAIRQPVARRPVVLPPADSPRSVEDYRRLIAMMELFGPPVSQRPPSDTMTPRLF